MSTKDEGYSAANEVSQLKSRRTASEHIWRGLKSAPPTAIFGMTVITLYLLIGIFAPCWRPSVKLKFLMLLMRPGAVTIYSAPTNWAEMFCRD